MRHTPFLYFLCIALLLALTPFTAVSPVLAQSIEARVFEKILATRQAETTNVTITGRLACQIPAGWIMADTATLDAAHLTVEKQNRSLEGILPHTFFAVYSDAATGVILVRVGVDELHNDLYSPETMQAIADGDKDLLADLDVILQNYTDFPSGDLRPNSWSGLRAGNLFGGNVVTTDYRLTSPTTRQTYTSRLMACSLEPGKLILLEVWRLTQQDPPLTPLEKKRLDTEHDNFWQSLTIMPLTTTPTNSTATESTMQQSVVPTSGLVRPAVVAPQIVARQSISGAGGWSLDIDKAWQEITPENIAKLPERNKNLASRIWQLQAASRLYYIPQGGNTLFAPLLVIDPRPAADPQQVLQAMRKTLADPVRRRTLETQYMQGAAALAESHAGVVTEFTPLEVRQIQNLQILDIRYTVKDVQQASQHVYRAIFPMTKGLLDVSLMYPVEQATALEQEQQSMLAAYHTIALEEPTTPNANATNSTNISAPVQADPVAPRPLMQRTEPVTHDLRGKGKLALPPHWEMSSEPNQDMHKLLRAQSSLAQSEVIVGVGLAQGIFHEQSFTLAPYIPTDILTWIFEDIAVAAAPSMQSQPMRLVDTHGMRFLLTQKTDSTGKNVESLYITFSGKIPYYLYYKQGHALDARSEQDRAFILDSWDIY